MGGTGIAFLKRLASANCVLKLLQCSVRASAPRPRPAYNGLRLPGADGGSNWLGTTALRQGCITAEPGPVMTAYAGEILIEIIIAIAGALALFLLVRTARRRARRPTALQ
jgi:hypothetical protein